MKKVIVIGCPGAGKSYFSYELCMQGMKERERTKRNDSPWKVAEADATLLQEVKIFYISHTRQDADQW